MNDVTINQAYLFLIFILNGIFIGVVFDIFRILRKSFNTPNIITYIEDFIFWTISALSIIYTLFVFNNGEIRAYIFIGLFLGIILYMLFFSKIFVKISVKIIVFIKNIVYNVLKVVMYPFLVVLKVLKSIADITTKKFKKQVSSLKNNVKKCHKKDAKSKSRKKLENKEGF